MKIIKQICRILLIAAFWVGVWALAARLYGKELLFPMPWDVVKTLWALLKTGTFYLTAFRSLWNVFSGILIAVFCGVLLSAVTSRFSIIRSLILPAMTVMKATPVASFIILLWLLIGAARVPTFITALIVLPIIWTNLDVGLQKISQPLSEVAIVYRMSRLRRLRLLTIPSLSPYFISACRTSLGLAWKAGVAAEIISMPKDTIGTMIAESKLYINSAEMFAWTLTVILLSILIEVAFSKVFSKLTRGLCERRISDADIG